MKLNNTAQTLETIAAAAAEKDPAIEEALKAYETLPEKFRSAENMLSQIDALTPDRVPTLKPRQIDQLLAIIIQNGVVEKTGVYINHLIQDSYGAGHNDFTLNTRDTTPNNIGYELEGRPENRLQLTIQGNIGDYCGWGAEHCEINIQGNAEYFCGEWARNCEINIQRKTGKWCGRHAIQSNFTIAGEIGDGIGHASANCMFKTKTIEFRTDEQGNIVTIR